MNAMTYKLAIQIAMDAGNRNMREHGRRAWTKDDWHIAFIEFDRLWPMAKP